MSVRDAEMRVREAAVLRVVDSGIGIAADVLPRIFELFAQGVPAHERSGSGLGIGLTLVRRLVDMHGGRITAASEGAGRGSEFVVRLPLREAPAAGSARSASPGGRPRRIVVIEDSEDSRESLRTWLEAVGHHVDVAPDGPRGIALALERDADVVLIDLGLPGLDGYAVARALRATPSGATMRLVAVTGYGQAADRERSRDAGFDAHLVKPVMADALSALVE